MRKVHSLTEDEFKNLVNKYFRGANILLADDLTVVIRAHLLVERLIEMLLRKKLVNIKILEHNDFTFNMKLALVDSLGIISDRLLSAIRQLNNIRNRFAHNISSQLRDVDISEITKFLNSKDYFIKFKGDNKSMLGLGVSYLLGYLIASAFNDNAKINHKGRPRL